MAGQVPQVPPPDLLEPLGVKVVSALGSPGQETVTTPCVAQELSEEEESGDEGADSLFGEDDILAEDPPLLSPPPAPGPATPAPLNFSALYSTRRPHSSLGGAGAGVLERTLSLAPTSPNPGRRQVSSKYFYRYFYKYIINFIRGRGRCPPTLPSARRGNPSSARPSARSTRRAGRRGTTARASRSSHS